MCSSGIKEGKIELISNIRRSISIFITFLYFIEDLLAISSLLSSVWAILYFVLSSVILIFLSFVLFLRFTVKCTASTGEEMNDV